MSDKGHEPARLRRPIARAVELYSEAMLPTTRGEFRTAVFRERRTGLEHLAMIRGEVAEREGVTVRVHSECLTSEVFGSLKCDCKAQLEHALDVIASLKLGVVLYLRQEGRGIGLGNKIRAYKLQSEGHDTYEANRLLGFGDDLRRYDVAAEILRLIGVQSVDLITNNPLKIAALVEEGIPVRRRVPSRAPVQPHNSEYLRVKKERSGHFLVLPDEPEDGGEKTGS